jgi:hypothetical protein
MGTVVGFLLDAVLGSAAVFDVLRHAAFASLTLLVAVDVFAVVGGLLGLEQSAVLLAVLNVVGGLLRLLLSG